MADNNNFIVNGENTIPSGFASDLMRMSMENKNLLKTKGSIYVGTGRTNKDGIAITEALEPGEPNTVLTVLDSEGTLGYSKVTPQMVESGTYYNIQCSKSMLADNHVSHVENTDCASYALSGEGAAITIYNEFKSLNTRIATTITKISAIKNKWPEWPLDND